MAKREVTTTTALLTNKAYGYPTRGEESRRSSPALHQTANAKATAIEVGLDAALPAVFELSATIAEFGRGERDSPATNDLPITMRLAEPPEPFDWLRSA